MTTVTAPPTTPGHAAGDTAVHVDGLWKIFGPRADKIMQSGEAQLSRRELQEKTGHVVGIRDVSFDVAPGEVFVVMGLSGSGKSTLVRLLTRLIEPTAGTVRLFDEDVTAMSDRALLDTRRRRVSMVFQHFGLLPHRKVVDNVAFGLEVRGEGRSDRRNRAQEMVDLVGLSGYENNFPDQLSGGMQQRVGLARALASDPDIMMFDEPFSALDPLIRRDMQNEVIRLHHEVGKTMVFITHDLAEALKLGDRILIMRDGEIVQIGTPDEVVGAPADDYVRDFTSDVPKSHVLTLKWVMRDPDGHPGDGPALPVDQIVKDAARVVLDYHGTCRVVDGDRVVGVVDDQDILRVVVAEEGVVVTSTQVRERTALARGVSKEQQPYVEVRAPRRTGVQLLGLLVVWLVLYEIFKGKQTKALAFQDTTALHRKLNDFRDWVQLHGADNWFFGGVLGHIGRFFNSLVTHLQQLVSTATATRPVPEIGWVGVVALLAWVTFVVAGLRSTILVTVSLLLFGVVGLWPTSLDLLIITFLSVLLCVVIGLPIGIWMARSKAASAAITPVLDLMQTLPAFCYLAPLTLFFGIGASAAIPLTFIYALPPLVRITEHGIRSVSPTTVEAARSMGLTRRQMLRQVQLPMAKRTIVVGINQSTMAALSMATIAALVAGPGLGQPVIDALQILNVGAASVAGLAIVVMAIMLDRTTTAASERSTGRTNVASASGMGVMLTGVVLERLPRWATEDAGRGQRLPRVTTAGRWLLFSVLLVPMVFFVWLSRYQLRYAQFPDVSGTPVLKELSGATLTRHINDFTDWFVGGVDTVTIAVKNHVTSWLIDPLQSLLSQSPWWLMAVVLLALAFVLGGWRPTLITVVCEAVIYGSGVWNDAMVTLSMTLIATALVMAIAIVLGVAMGRGRRADLAIRPFLDAFQVIPPFVYLVPALALFGPTRFTAIVAATAYAVPIATKLVADGIRGVSPTTVEAARSSGITRWQMITKVQLPMARESLVLATNQGLLYVLGMVVIGGLVGGGSLGYIVVSGFSQGQLFGKGLAAGVAIAALGVMLDRVARYAAARYGT